MMDQEEHLQVLKDIGNGVIELTEDLSGLVKVCEDHINREMKEKPLPPAPVVNVAPAQVTIQPPPPAQVTVTVPKQSPKWLCKITKRDRNDRVEEFTLTATN